jgi:hypothetical protein
MKDPSCNHLHPGRLLWRLHDLYTVLSKSEYSPCMSRY